MPLSRSPNEGVDSRTSWAIGRASAGRPRLGLARGVLPFLLGTFAAALVSGLLTRSDRRWAAPTALAAALTGGLAWLFRDPQRVVGRGRLLAAADGVVRSVERRPDGRVRVATFMSLLDVHVNRVPIGGTVTSVEYHSGAHMPAFKEESERNERMVWVFSTELGDVEVVQIAGILARRIVPYLEPGTTVKQGDRLGLIRLGSRVDVYLPAGIEPSVEVGQRTRAGQTRLDKG